MPRFLLRRLFHLLLLVVGLLTVVFFLVHLMPGDPVGIIDEQALGEETRGLVRQRLGLAEPLWRQYAVWLRGVAVGDLGTSLRQQRPVTDIILEALPNTLLLTISAYLLELMVGVFIGVTSARYPAAWRTRLLNGGGLLLYSLPSFWLGLVAIMFFGRELGWLPVGGLQSPDAAWLAPGARGLDRVRHLLLPMLVLGLGNVAVSARFLRGNLARVLASDWVLAARARGLPERRVIWRHALRAASLPIITYLGYSLPRLVGGAVAVEEVFAWPGLGRVAVQALLARDYPVIIAVTAVVAVLVGVGGLVADLLARWADPRLRLDGKLPEVR